MSSASAPVQCKVKCLRPARLECGGEGFVGESLVLSTLPKTWIFDLDGTLLKHNGYNMNGEDTFLSDAKEYLFKIPPEDKIIILTSRTEEYRALTVLFLEQCSIRYDVILFK